jgi:heat-inducible transcriptional repressor
LAEKKILGVVVTKGGVVRDRVFRVEHDLSQNDLDSAARYLNEEFRGSTLDSIRKELARRLEQERREYDGVMQSVKELYQGGALGGDPSRTVFVEGVSNLLVNESDRDRLRQLLRTLEEKQRVVDLLSAYVDEKQEAVRVVIGLEEAMPDMRNFVLIGAPARVGQEVMGSLAVIGPTRMDYEHTITAVSYIAQLFDKILNEPEP